MPASITGHPRDGSKQLGPRGGWLYFSAIFNQSRQVLMTKNRSFQGLLTLFFPYPLILQRNDVDVMTFLSKLVWIDINAKRRIDSLN